MNVNKININQTEPTYYIASDIYDVSAHNDGATFESLSALLSDENLSTLIPSKIRCGGMTIRFVQSFDNKYVQYRLLTTSFSTTETDWEDVTIMGTDRIADGAITYDKLQVEIKEVAKSFFYDYAGEYVAIKIDKEAKIISAIKKDGTVFAYKSQNIEAEIDRALIKNAEIDRALIKNAEIDRAVIKGVCLDDIIKNLKDITETNYLEANGYAKIIIDSKKNILEKTDLKGTVEHYTEHIFDKIGISKIQNAYRESCAEYIKVEKDSEGRIYLAVERNGTVFIPFLKTFSDGIINIKVNSRGKGEDADVIDYTTTNGLSWNAVGTSVTQGYYADGSDGSTGAELLTPKLYVAQVANELGLNARNLGVGGTTICVNSFSNEARNYYNDSIVERVCGLNGNISPSDADIWTIEGGANDIGYKSKLGSPYSTSDEIDTVYGALKRIIEFIQDRPNNPRIFLINWCFIKYECENEELAFGINNAFKWASHYYGIPLINLHDISGLSPKNITRLTIGDGVHPSAEGTNMFKHKIANFIKNNI